MLKHKKLLSALLAAVMLFTVTGCGGTDDEAEDAGATSWEETANITATDETDEELYEQAIAEGGAIVHENPVVADEFIITSRGAGTALELGLELVRQLLGDQAAEEVSRGVVLAR